ncbi:MAG: hypothetical protein IJ633_04895 [Prevotella sp.]|nr:hypothetical protein [Prevotella sp.]
MKRTLLISMLLTLAMRMSAAIDPNFYIYLCFGQSNMEGQAQAETVDKTVDDRFQALACVDFNTTTPKRTKGQWYPANCPIVRDWTNIGMADYFGRTMVAALPSNVKVGVVDVAIGGIAIDGFSPDKTTVDNYLATTETWLQNSAKQYDDFPYQRLVDMAKIAQQSGVIKGILLHQGESDNGQQVWLDKVKNIYEHLLADLGLNAADVPLFAGETVNADVGGVCSYHNTIIAQLPSVIPTAHVIHSNGCPCASDNIHFTVSGYRTMGKRYAYEALKVMGKETKAQEDYNWNADLKKVYSLSKLNEIADINIRKGGSKVLTLRGTFADGHEEDLINEATFTSDDFTIKDGAVISTEEKTGIVKASYTDFLGVTHTLDINVTVSDQGPNHVLVVNNTVTGSNAWDKEAICKLITPMEKGKTYTIHITIWGDQSGSCALWPRWDASTNRDQWGNSADLQYLKEEPVTTTPQKLTWTCSANNPHDALIFAIGKMGAGNVYFDDVSCIEQGSTTEMVSNGSFEMDNLSNWYFANNIGTQTTAIKEDPTAGIELLRQPVKTDGTVYNLQGIKVGTANDWSTLPHGVYIVNGKIVIR